MNQGDGMNEPVHVNEGVFEKAVLNSPLPVLVDFWAPWCAPCRMVAPSLEKIAQDYAGRLLVAKVNTDENNELAARYQITGIPTLMFISNGQIVNQQVGALSYAVLKQMVDQFLEAANPAATPQN
jgi:thioredoxin 1